MSDPDRDLKVAGETGIICCTADGEPIYRTTFYDVTGEQADTFIPHANGDAIRQANAEGAGAEAIAQDEFKAEDVEESEEQDSLSIYDHPALELTLLALSITTLSIFSSLINFSNFIIPLISAAHAL